MSLIPSSIVSAASLDEALAGTLLYFAADSGTIHMLESDGILHLKAASGGIPDAVIERVRLVPVGKGMAGLAVERGQPVTACNIQTDASGDVRPGAKLTGLEGAIVVPMMRYGKAVGALGIANRAERTFTEEEQTLLHAIGSYLAVQYG
ncbi:MAG: GAF domain-containing protein [Bryobacterales bacterium]|nr:GAF domain-containing protein [Bryobacterales bacterium]